MILFDLDGTLVDSADIWVQIDIDFTKRHHLELTKEYLDVVAYATSPTAAAFTKDYYNLDLSVEEIMQEWSGQAYQAYSSTIKAKPYVHDYLAQCRRQGEHMSILTSSSPELCHATLEHNGLLSYFDHLFFAQELGIEKSDPSLFQAVADWLGTPIEDCTVYDDSPVACRSAYEAGAHIIGVYDKIFAKSEPELRSFCDRYILNFSELLDNTDQEFCAQ